MNDLNLVQLLFFILPAVITGGVAFYFFKTYTDNENKKRLHQLRLENQKTSLPLRLQAFERMTLFLERISLGKLLIRIKPEDFSKEEYEQLLILNIEQEFEHNLAQQIYFSNECWNFIRTSKNATIAIIRKTAAKKEIETASNLREVILTNLMEQTAPTEAALDYIKKEVKSFI
ncbi:hypothetical protein L1I30_06095 [Gillisia sp. M10.2A]|uniref:Uncharacterized protein n=1 Tax=Gillisia lutea TaxID=2909668 RepID=A0ABS9EEE2_9FLAO|nr:hypothetical protein [Gillisia lutea]MCF4101228.1 hypothetical protein [Gillisia lutea]